MNKLISLQYLRAIAALTVTVVHLQAPLERLGFDGWLPAAFGSGVDIFFVISGVVMWLSTANQPDLTPQSFFMRRLTRIVPLYWIVTLFIVAVMVTYPSAVNNGTFEITHVVASVFFIPVEHPTLTDQLYPVFVPGWTINAEMFFYVVFALSLLIAPRFRIIAVTSFFVLLVLLGAYFQPTGMLSFYTRPLILEFVFGLILGRLFTSGLRMSAGAAGMLLIAGVVALIEYSYFEQSLMNVDRIVVWGIPAAMIVAGMLYLERANALRNVPAIRFLGDASYSIYMTNTITLSACGFILARVGSGLAPETLQIVYVALGLAATIVVSVLCYLLLERPLTRWLARTRLRGGSVPVRA